MQLHYPNRWIHDADLSGSTLKGLDRNGGLFVCIYVGWCVRVHCVCYLRLLASLSLVKFTSPYFFPVAVFQTLS